MTHDHAAYMRKWRQRKKDENAGALIVAWEMGFAAAQGYDLNNPEQAKVWQAIAPARWTDSNPYRDVSRGTSQAEQT